MIEDPQAGAQPTGRLGMLMTLLDEDPGNRPLLADAAEAALLEQRPDVADTLLGRYAAIAPLPPRELNLAGLAAMQQAEFGKAAECFERLIADGADDSAVRFNLAWARAMQKDWDGALALLDPETVAELPQAAMLEIRILHERGEFDTAMERGRTLIEVHPEHAGLMAAVSVLALDVDDPELAGRCAAKAGDHPDALITWGTLGLGKGRATEALDLFERALQRNPKAPRAWIGLGLAKLLTDAPASAAEDLDRGAELFGDHLGSWIAAGWAHFVAGDLARSRERFETALGIDPTFAETHGSLAVLDLLEGKADEARERSEVATRLDRDAYSGALAKALLATRQGEGEEGRKIFDRALGTPVDASGRTIAQAMARLGLGRAL